ncbi:hypothetical protein LX36DRAFT_649695 [Colletotrichum falcatum]|nr:hypothetical protein LX36DRAFT_649695 [Colletotrichum falcatum]
MRWRKEPSPTAKEGRPEKNVHCRKGKKEGQEKQAVVTGVASFVCSARHAANPDNQEPEPHQKKPNS